MDPCTPIITKNANRVQAVYMVSMGSSNKFNYITCKYITKNACTFPSCISWCQWAARSRQIFITIQVQMTAGKRKETNKQTLQVGQSCPQQPAHNAGLPNSFFNSDTWQNQMMMMMMMRLSFCRTIFCSKTQHNKIQILWLNCIGMNLIQFNQFWMRTTNHVESKGKDNYVKFNSLQIRNLNSIPWNLN